MDKKNKLLEVATLLFSERGYENTSVALICETAGVSKGLVFHHFKSKDGLLRAIFVHTTKKVVETENASSTSTTDPYKRLHSLIESLFAQLETHKTLFQLNLNLIIQPKTRVLLKDLIDQRSAYIFSFVNAIFMEIDSKDAVVNSYLFIAELDGIALHYLSIYDPYPLHDIKKLLIKKYSSK